MHGNLGVALKDQGKLDEAVACYRRALELNPDFAAAHSNLGNALQDLGRPEEAIACHRRALQLKPEYAEAHNNLGNALKDQGHLDEAIACYRRAQLNQSLKEALLHGGLAHNVKVNIHWIEAESFEKGRLGRELENFDGILVPGGFGKRGIEGMINAIEYARANRVPYFGICLGMQTMVIEFARNVCGLTEADSTEFNPATPQRVIYKLRELKGIDELGGTMRLGAWECHLRPGSFAYKAYGTPVISERHRHRYEFNRDFEPVLTANGLKITGETESGTYVEICEIEDHPFYLAASSIRNSNRNRWNRIRCSAPSSGPRAGSGRTAWPRSWRRCCRSRNTRHENSPGHAATSGIMRCQENAPDRRMSTERKKTAS